MYIVKERKISKNLIKNIDIKKYLMYNIIVK